MSDIPSVNSDQGTTPIPVNEDHTKVTTSSTQDTIDSSHTIQENADPATQEKEDLASKEHEISPQAQKIIDAFLQQSDLSDADKATIKEAIPSVSSSSGSSTSADDNSAEDEVSTTEATTTPTSTYTQGDDVDTSDKTQSTEGFTAPEQQFYDTVMGSEALSDTQKGKIAAKPSDFMDMVESEAKHMKGEKEDKEDFNKEIEANADYNPEKEADTTDYEDKSSR